MAYEDIVMGLGPLGYWPCDDDNDQDGPQDVSGNGMHLTKAMGSATITWTLDAEWGHMVLGGGDYNADPVIVENAAMVDTADPFSWSMWLRNEPGNASPFPDGMSQATANLETGSAGGYLGSIAAPWMDPDWQVEGATGDLYLDALQSSPWIDTWRHVCFVSDGTTGWLYADGAEVNTGSITAPGDPGYPILVVTGHIGHLALFDRELTPTEVVALASSPAPPPPPSVGLWDDFDRADGPIGTASPLGVAWDTVSGTWEIDTNQAAPSIDGFTGYASARLDLPDGAVVAAAEVTVVLPSGIDWTAGLMVAATDAGGLGLIVLPDFGGVLPVRFAAGSYTDSGVLATVDISAGSHTMAVRAERTTPTTWTVETWWDGDYTGSLTTGVALNEGGSVALRVSVIDGDLVRFDDLGGAWAPLVMPSVPAPELTGGVAPWVVPPDVISVPSVPAPELTGGVAPVPMWSELGPIFVPSVAAPPLLGGVLTTWSDTPNPPPPPGPDDPPWPPGYQPGPPTSELHVTGRWALAANCRPQMNDAGTGSFTCEPDVAPALGDEITYSSGGTSVFTGYADQIDRVLADPAEESGQLVTVTTPGRLGIDWGATVVYPDIGAYEPIRVGQPPQDDRLWGWPMNGLVVPGLTWVSSVGGDNTRFGTPREIFPPPDNWPDNRARYMWTTAVDVKSQPAGWCYFRQAFGSWPGEHSLFVCAYDYARVYIDGVLVATCDQPGQTVRVDLDFDWDFHLCAVEAYAQGGSKAGVLLSVLRRGATGFGGTGLGGAWLVSGPGWKALQRPQVSMRSTVGKVLRRLVDEAQARGAPAGRWSCSFSDDADSAGTPWPAGAAAPLITTRVGATYTDVLAQVSESMIDYWPDPRALVLHAFVKGTGGSAGPIPWTVATDHTSAESYVERTAGR